MCVLAPVLIHLWSAVEEALGPTAVAGELSTEVTVADAGAMSAARMHEALRIRGSTPMLE